MLNISIKAEPLFHIFGFPITNSFVTSLVVLVLLILLAHFYDRQLEQKKKSRFFYFIHFLITQIYNLFYGVTKEKTAVLFPLLGAFFLFIMIQNWFGLLPGVGSIIIKMHEEGKTVPVPLFRGGVADLNMTLALGIVAFIAIQYFGVKFVGAAGYLKKFFNFKGPIDFALGLLEIISEFSRIISFSFRLFGNIFAGEVLLMVIAFLVPVLVSFPFLLMEIFVGFIQALVFSMLAAVFLQMATAKHH